jgi:hypothetical protein
VQRLADAFMENLRDMATLCNQMGPAVKIHPGGAALTQQDMRKLLSSVSVHRTSGGKK